jgi:hypothetical protein
LQPPEPNRITLSAEVTTPLVEVWLRRSKVFWVRKRRQTTDQQRPTTNLLLHQSLSQNHSKPKPTKLHHKIASIPGSKAELPQNKIWTRRTLGLAK